MNLIKSIVKSVLANVQLKKKYLTVSKTTDSSNKERGYKTWETKI